MNNLNTNPKVHIMADQVNYVLIPFEWNINTLNPQGIKLYLQSTKEMDKESDKIDISVSKPKEIIDNFLSLVNKYDWGCLEFMVRTDSGDHNIFWKSEQINIMGMHAKLFRYFGLQGIGIVNQVLTKKLVLNDQLNIATDPW